MEIFTLAFRKINSQTVRAYGPHTFQWNLSDTKGVQVADGVYYVRIQIVGGAQSTTKIMKVLVLK
jgi:flagellar hook assembly protein FlgD